VAIKRRKSESFESFMRRTKDAWKKSGRVQQVKKIQFYDSKKKVKNKAKRKASALKRIEVSQKMQYLEKIGRLPVDPRTKFKKK
jgi:ribosomal protein S21